MPDNPAQRLHDFLVAMQSQSANRTMGEALARILGVNKDDTPTLLCAAAEIIRLPEQACRQLVSVPGIDEDLFLQWRPSVNHALTYLQNLTGNGITPMISSYDAATLLGLRHASHQLRTMNARDVPGEQMEELTREIEALRHLIETADELDGTLRLFLLDLVNEMTRAVVFYRIQGIDAIEEVFERSLGAIALRYKRSQTLPPTISQKFRTVFATMARVVGFANSSYELSGNVVEAIAEITS